MSEARFGRLQKAATLVPLALLSAAWSVSIVGVGLTGSTATSADGGTLPDGSTVPAEAIEAPASLTGSSKLAPGIKGDPQEAVLNAATNGIPSAALAAYQRAETVINAADTTCHLPWQLVAAIGRVGVALHAGRELGAGRQARRGLDGLLGDGAAVGQGAVGAGAGGSGPAVRGRDAHAPRGREQGQRHEGRGALEAAEPRIRHADPSFAICLDLPDRVRPSPAGTPLQRGFVPTGYARQSPL
jgi:hypothetical protein